ncbi:hypothetical protein GCM10009122_40950 [Fulvivirga kasyanovii]|uniref:Type II toxin-antitoxin system RelE/ParE family toxin n=1 Tax=Fulvivirga kasyanovii TaxID=396812 RepID=A0ABW9RTK9_9BACT|nr:type II toxin-antitoxin system RelE/ParE family toxin [Fulvivirga kasyanovii]MTI27534.1 type II toxin-antitoxin system RelE/ParE family toxin [Fulvivirga kasyanovii]
MAYKIRYSLRARQEEIELLDFILKEFGEQKAKAVYQRVEKLLGEISGMPKMYRSSKKQKHLRKCVLSKQTSIYYRIQKDYIEVVSFRANRKDPKGFKA